MGRTAEGTFTDQTWAPPVFSVDENGKIIGLTNDNVPNNWGRWGDQDQRGTANFITPDVVSAAAGLIRSGKSISLAVPLDSTGPVHPTRPNVVHFFGYSGADWTVGTELGRVAPGFQGADDYIFMPLQGSTQWDGLAHIFSSDAMYNGFWMGNVEGVAGAKKCAISNLKDSLTSRGVLLDLPKYLGVERCEPGVPITAAQLDGCAQAQGVEVRTGDILTIRTGHVPWFYSLHRQERVLGCRRTGPGRGHGRVDPREGDRRTGRGQRRGRGGTGRGGRRLPAARTPDPRSRTHPRRDLVARRTGRGVRP